MMLPKLKNARNWPIPWRIQTLTTKLKKLHDLLFPSSCTPASDVQEEEEKKKEEPLKGTTKDEPIDLSSDSENDVTSTSSSDTSNNNDNINVMEDRIVSASAAYTKLPVEKQKLIHETCKDT